MNDTHEDLDKVLYDPWAEHDEMLGYDADHNDPKQYCRHGTFIGSWWGPDYMCYYCETGDEPPTAEELRAEHEEMLRKREIEFDKAVEASTKACRQHGYRFIAGLAQGIYDMADNYYFAPVAELYD